MSARAFLNIGSTDRVLRLVLGLAVLSLAFIGPRTPFGYLGLVPIFTALIGNCPLYSLMGWSSRRGST